MDFVNDYIYSIIHNFHLDKPHIWSQKIVEYIDETKSWLFKTRKCCMLLNCWQCRGIDVGLAVVGVDVGVDVARPLMALSV